jgi:hypothetical protein
LDLLQYVLRFITIIVILLRIYWNDYNFNCITRLQ